jgi:uncharacterized protein YkwD
VNEFTILGVLVFIFFATFVFQVYRSGFIIPLANLLTFCLSLLSALLVFSPLSILLSVFLGFSKPLADVSGFLLAFFAFFIPLHLIIVKLSHQVFTSKKRSTHLLDKPPGLKTAIVGSTIWLVLIASLYNLLPVNPFANETASSKLSIQIAKAAIAFDARPKKSLEQKIDSSLESIEDKEIIAVKPNIPPDAAKQYDGAAELEMLRLVNDERRKHGLDALVLDSKLRDVARSHSMDMVRGNFFNHVSPRTGTIGDRLQANQIFYLFVSENLAYSTDVTTANKDILLSKAHHDSLMSQRFGKIGIGVVDCGMHGCMITQIVTN